MSTLTENVQKVVDAHAALKIAIEGKGVTVPAGTKLTGMPALVDQIQTGGGGGQDYGYLTFTAAEASTLKLMQQGGIEQLSLLKSTDAQNWTKWENPQANAISLQAGESVYLKADEDAPRKTCTGDSVYNRFVTGAGAIACTGVLTALIKPVVPADYSWCFAYLFRECASLTNAPALPATTLTDSCYKYMFDGCTSLTAAPALPATTLPSNCYQYMFQSCTSLTAAPALPATMLAYMCYSSMFRGCTSLTEAPELPATDLGQSYSCYEYMFDGCTSLTAAPALPATTLPSNCYQGMFRGCTSLTEAPELPATDFDSSSYKEMFDGCTSLTAAPALPVTTLSYMCYSGMFQGCTSLTNAPELPATNMNDCCYEYMFQSCWSLKRIKMNASSGSWGSGMFLHCSQLELVDMTGSTGVPTLSYSNNFEDIGSRCKIVVPDSLYDTWIAATNWAAIASRIMKQSDWNAAHPDDQL